MAKVRAKEAQGRTLQTQAIKGETITTSHLDRALTFVCVDVSFPYINSYSSIDHQGQGQTGAGSYAPDASYQRYDTKTCYSRIRRKS